VFFTKIEALDSNQSRSVDSKKNKWLKLRARDRRVIHSFWHSLIDRLREVKCPSDVLDAIGGWPIEAVGQGYDKGYGLELKARWMQKLT
jgi:hypothetical protein